MKNRLTVATVAIAAALTSWQLFKSPIVGLADQGDFVRILGPLGYAPQPKGPEHKYDYLTRTYVQDLSYREPRWEQITSEFIPAATAVFLNRILLSPREFDLTMIGFVHMIFFLAGLYRLLKSIESFANYPGACALILLVVTDVGYVAYWNSLYTEPASFIWLLFLIAETIPLARAEPLKPAAIARWTFFAALWIAAKTQNAVLAVPLALYAVTLLWRATEPKTRWTAAASVLCVLATGATMYRTLLPAPRLVGIYNMVFMAILPESKHPEADLQILGLDTSYARYSGTLPWSPNTGVADGYLVNAMQERVTPMTVVKFYVQRPRRLWGHIRTLLPGAFSLRPEFCGNFESSAGYPPGAISHSFALWSAFHQRILGRIAPLVLIALAIAPLAFVAALFSPKIRASSQRPLELAICLTVCCVAMFFSAAFGDAYDNVKHQYLFNVLLDVSIVWLLLAALPSQRKSPPSAAN